jgi:hypothetical protein
MSFPQFIVIPIFIAFQAFVMMVIARYVPGSKALGGGLLTWISFQAWAMYFLAGCTPKMGLKTLAGYAGGILASIAIFELGDLLVGPLGGYWGYPVAVFIVVIFVISAEKVPGIDFIPAWFLGAGVFFAFVGGAAYMATPVEHTISGYTSIAVPEIIGCIVGLIFGYITVTFRTRYEKAIAPKSVDTPATKED